METRKTGFTLEPRTQVQTDVGVPVDPGLTERRCQLTVLTGESAGTIVEVASPSFRVGKDDAADLVLKDPTVSREHFVIEQQGGAFVIRDQRSTNGTWIDQFRIREAYLRPGVVVRAGEVQLRFEPLFKRMDVAPSAADRFGSLVGRSVRMRQVFALLERVSKTEATVVILGETGSGKSAIARAIHEASPRGGAPFITVDCGAIAENLIESELFGHEKGSFTGATRTRQGALEQAQGGTLFIDELADLRLDLQPRLLRVLEEREVRRVGSNEPIKLDVRIIAASRKDLWREVEAGRFREDLYFRLAVFAIPLAPLRERREDIPALAHEFARSLKGGEKLLARFTPDVMSRLMEHPFYGNVRELRNVIERAIYLDGDPTDFLGPLGMSGGGAPSGPPPAAMGDPLSTEGAPLVEARGPGRVTAPPSIAPSSPAAVAPPPVAPPPAAPPPVALQAPHREATRPTALPPSDTPGGAIWHADGPLTASGLVTSEGEPAGDQVQLSADLSLPFKDAKEQLLERFEVEYLKRVLARVEGGASAVAREMGIDRKHLYNLAKKHGIDLSSAKDR